MNKQIYRETILYIGGTLLLIIVGFASKSLQTKGLNPEDFGNYTFIISYISFCVLFFQFGYIPSIKLALAENEDPILSKKILGTGFIVTTILGLLFSFFIFLSSFFIDGIFNTHVSEILFICSPLFFSFLFVQFFNAAAIGLGKPSFGVLFELISRSIFTLILFWFFIQKELEIMTIVFFSALSHIATIISFLFILKPEFRGLTDSWNTLKRTHRKFGKDYFLGSVMNQSTFKIDDLMIAAWVNPIQLGFYALARLLTSPIGLASTAINNAMFRSYSKLDRIPQNVFVITALISLSGVVIINLIGSIIIDYIFGPEYLEAGNYILLFSLAFFFMAMYQPFNFLTAKGKGKVVRNTALVESGINILGNFILIPIIGLLGALITTLLARAVHFFMKWYYYCHYLTYTKKENGE